jgi:YgiT-type zinc finger domain-containing protein
MAKCYICEKGELKKKKVDYSLYGESLGKFEAEVCTKCGDTFFSEETSDKITLVAKKKGLWGLEAKTKIGQSGSTLDVRLPQKIIAYMKLKKGKEVTIIPESKHKLVLTV